MKIETSADWWYIVETKWDQLLNILKNYLSPNDIEDAEKAKIKRNWETLHHYFEEAWWHAPDNRSIHYIPGWFDLCDLCSEVGVFEENKDEKEEEEE